MVVLPSNSNETTRSCMHRARPGNATNYPWGIVIEVTSNKNAATLCPSVGGIVFQFVRPNLSSRCRLSSPYSNGATVEQKLHSTDTGRTSAPDVGIPSSALVTSPPQTRVCADWQWYLCRTTNFCQSLKRGDCQKTAPSTARPTRMPPPPASSKSYAPLEPVSILVPHISIIRTKDNLVWWAVRQVAFEPDFSV